MKEEPETFCWCMEKDTRKMNNIFEVHSQKAQDVFYSAAESVELRLPEHDIWKEIPEQVNAIKSSQRPMCGSLKRAV